MAESKFIPMDIVVKIFSRLPCKSLLRFKCGCKSWHSLISNPSFIRRHSRQSRRRPKLFFNSISDRFQVFDVERSSFHGSFFSRLEFPLETKYSGSLAILGSACGLLCVAHRDRFYLWNPFTREFRNISSSAGAKFDGHCAHGLGYDPVSRDLKLVVSQWLSNTCKVFSSKSSSWKSIKPHPRLHFRNNPHANREAVVVNGVFYWTKEQYLVIGFDSTKDKLLDLYMPRRNTLGLKSPWLLEHKGHLCLSLGKKFEEEIWMLKEQSWIYFLRIPWRRVNLRNPLRPIYISGNNSQAILHNKHKILRFTYGGKQLEEIDPHPLTVQDPVMCYETLMSPNGIIIKSTGRK